MADKSSEQLELEYNLTRSRFHELAARTKSLADKTLQNTIASTKLQANTSAASLALRGITNVAPALQTAITQAAKSSMFMGTELQRTTAAVKTASKAHDETTKQLRRVKDALGEEANTISGINAVEKARKAASAARTELFNREIEQIDAAMTLQTQVIAESTRLLAEKQSELAVTQTAIATDQALIDTKTALIENMQDTIVGYKKHQENVDTLSVEVAAKESLITAVNGEIQLLNDKKALYATELAVHQSSIATMQADLAGTSLTTEQRRRMSGELTRLLAEEARLQTSIAGVNTEIGNQVSQLVTLNNDYRALNTKLQDEIVGRDLYQSELQTLTGSTATGSELLDISNAKLGADIKIRDDVTKRLADSKRAEISQIKAVQERTDALNENTETLSELAERKQDAIADENTAQQMDLNDAIKATRDKWNIFGQTLSKVAANLNKLVAPILELQKQFGVSAGTAAKLKFQNLSNAVDSYITSLMTGGPAVGTKEIEEMQGAFGGEFGGVLTSDAARSLSEEAKRLGVGAGEMAKARRVFMTQTMGDTGKAKAAQDKFIGEFAKKGLTAKDAMAAIGQNSELLARNGTRFATSFARAAAEAKKIGVDLSKIDQVGDNIIGNFEGFLESQAELGAMGFGFDTSKLAEIAESGDTGALMGELRSQLASTGKDITKLRRSEQLALSQAFGMSMEDLQRMAAPEGGSGEETLSPEELQKDANKSLGDLVFRADAIVGILGTIATVIAAINTQMMARTFATRGANLRTGATSILSRVGSSGLANRVGGIGNLARIGAGTAAGLFGGVSGFMTAKNSGKSTTEAAGAGVVQGGLAAAGAVLGSFAGPLGTMVGGFLGNTLGKAVNKYFPSFGANIGLIFKGIASAFKPITNMLGVAWENIKKLGEPLSKLTNLFGSTTGEANNLWPVLEKVGYFIGTVLLIPFNLLVMAITTVTGVITSLAQLLSGDFSGAWNTVKTTIFSVINSIISVLNALPGVNIPKIGEQKKGDDVVSKAGYGQRTLVTPTQTIALNNNDNVLAYADDMISGAANEGIRMLSYGALASKETAAPQINIDMSRLEAKLDAVVRAIGSMEVKMDGNKVGKVLVNGSDSARTVGVFRQDARATL